MLAFLSLHCKHARKVTIFVFMQSGSTDGDLRMEVLSEVFSQDVKLFCDESLTFCVGLFLL